MISVMRSLLVSVCLVIGPPAFTTPPMEECLVARGNWCLLSYGEDLKIRGLPDGETLWNVYSRENDEAPKFSFIESLSCRRTEFTGYVDVGNFEYFTFGGHKYVSKLYSLTEDGGCTMRILFGALSRNSLWELNEPSQLIAVRVRGSGDFVSISQFVDRVEVSELQRFLE